MKWPPEHPPEEGSISQRFQEERFKVGLTLKQLAEKLPGIHLQKLNWIESPAGQPLDKLKSIDWLRLAMVGMDIQYILIGTRGNELCDQLSKVTEPVAEYESQDLHTSLIEAVRNDWPDVAVLRQVIERVERILMDEKISLSADQKARVIVACMYASIKDSGDTSTHISTAIRAVI